MRAPPPQLSRTDDMPTITADVDSEGRSEIDVLLVDDRHAAAYSVWAMLNWQPSIRVIGTATTSTQALAATKRHAPNVCLVSTALCSGDTLRMVDRLKQLADPPAVLLYADGVDASMRAAAIIAGADGVVWRYGDPRQLIDSLTQLGAGDERSLRFSSDTPQQLMGFLADRDRAIAAMLLLGCHRDDIARTLGISARALTARRQHILSQLDEAIMGLDMPTTAVSGGGVPGASPRRSQQPRRWLVGPMGRTLYSLPGTRDCPQVVPGCSAT
jgi:DNA-binding NarL/FixJ family response regulator